MRCSFCGEEAVQSNAKFCWNCGNAIIREPAVNAEVATRQDRSPKPEDVISAVSTRRRQPSSDTHGVDSESDQQHLELLAQWGDPQAQLELGRRYERGVGVSQDYVKAGAWYQQSADAGNPEAQVALGELYEHGRGVPAEARTALKWYLKAAGQAFPGARLRHENLDAKEGRASAQFSMGRRFEEGDGVGQNLADAAHWYRLAAEQGYSSAQFRLGTMCRLGLGLDRNIEHAVHWLTLAAQAGDTRAEYAVGNLYDTEDSIRDAASAFAFYKRAAVKGHKDAQRRLAQLLAQGLGVEQDAREAAKWQALADQPVLESAPCGWDESWHGNPGWGGHR